MARPGGQRRWIGPAFLLAGIALSGFVGLYALDYYTAPAGSLSGPDPLRQYASFDGDKITDAVSALAAMIAAVFGIVITVVSIVVQLSAERYTGVTRMFLRDRFNLAVMAYYVVVTVYGIWLSVGLHGEFVPRLTLLTMLLATTFGLVVMAPYFGYVFWFLEPANIIDRIRRDAENVVRATCEADEMAVAPAQVATVGAMEELTDITSNSISGKDKIIASHAVDALKDFTLRYLAVKAKASHHWFDIGDGIKVNPDFVAMDPESLQDLAERRTWVEWKVMRQYLGIYNEALGPMRDINYLIAIDTRYIGEAAGRAGDRELMLLVFRYMNSYLRATLNARDVRTAYNVLNQYRLLVEAMIRLQHGALACEGVRHMLYYGHVSYDMKLTFVTETVAYDVSSLIQFANEMKAPEEEQMLAQFLDLDQPLRVQSQERALLGVRKAQVKLAAYYVASGQSEKARKIAADVREEPHERLRVIQEQLARVETKDFWEIIDRGRNFEFMPPRQREGMLTFFEWLDVPSVRSAS